MPAIACLNSVITPTVWPHFLDPQDDLCPANIPQCGYLQPEATSACDGLSSSAEAGSPCCRRLRRVLLLLLLLLLRKCGHVGLHSTGSPPPSAVANIAFTVAAASSLYHRQLWPPVQHLQWRPQGTTVRRQAAAYNYSVRSHLARCCYHPPPQLPRRCLPPHCQPALPPASRLPAPCETPLPPTCAAPWPATPHH